MDSMRFRAAADMATETEALRQRLRQALRAQVPNARNIHSLRVTCKRLRSLVRLCRQCGSKKLWRRHDRALRNTAAAFGALRDREVMHDTVALLQSRTRSKHARAACARLLAQLARQPRVACKHDSAAEALALAAFPATPLTTKQLARGLQKTRRRCRKLAQYVIDGGTEAVPLHALRKQVKYLGYQLELAAVPAATVTRLRKRLVILGSLLGDIHDLAMLELRLQQGICHSADDALLITTQAERRRLHLIRRAAGIAAAVFEH